MTKMVQLSDEAYARLRALKKGRESFSDVVLRLAPKGDVRDLRDLWKLGRTKEEIADHVREIHKIDALDRPTE